MRCRGDGPVARACGLERACVDQPSERTGHEVDTTYVEVWFERGSNVASIARFDAVAEHFGLAAFGDESLSDHDIPCGILHYGFRELGPLDVALQSIGVPFRAWESPRYEWRGSLSLWTPALGLWRGECDTHGDAILVEGHLDDTIVAAAGDLLPTRWEAEVHGGW